MVAAVSATPNPNKVSSQGGVHHQNNPKRPPLLPSEADNGVAGPPLRRPRSREVTSRYLSSSCTTSSSSYSSSSSSSSNSSSSRRHPSPLVSRTVPMTPSPAPSRSQSVERRRPGNAGEMSAAAKLLVASKRSLSVSFQGDSYSRKAKPAPATNNLTSSTRKETPERENSKPIIKDHQHRWPGRSRELNCSMTIRALQQQSIIMIDDSSKASVASPRLKANPNLDKAAQIVIDAISDAGAAATSDLVASDDTESVSSGSTGAGAGAVQECCVRAAAPVRGGRPRGIVVPARFWQETTNRLQRRLPEQVSPISKNNNGLKTVTPPKLNALKKSYMDSPISTPRGVSGSRGLSSPLRCGVRPASPSKLVTSSVSSPSRGMMSPSRVRNGGVASTVNNDLGNTPSILSFAADVRRGKVGDAHVLRLLHNRHLQWRFINARADNAMMVQKVTAERSLYNGWVATSKLLHSIKTKRIELQLLRQNLMLYSILKGQMLYLDDWDLIDWDHSNSLSGAIEALESSTLRLPIVGGARADIQNVKDAICSAVDVMQSMASSICSLLTKVDQVNPLLSELANTTAKERALLDQCKDLLSTLTAMQVKDCSMRTHILQLRCKPSGLTNEV
ncbi:QWRF motif-containing protein 2 [Camellia lanceoleosa]|uniref:QWRF motif-containing protein 2 n=1 Tax=Camellia lanceoleosa TaxID=1840588 RepID=A0ACC0GTV6_9ERIC|nr:QWRF motif-containing protein 2 [Camellia lanceoleosa]